jgi:ABC-type transport system involved in Fe-S cluster assembly fused permease/ATPase subunit
MLRCGVVGPTTRCSLHEIIRIVLQDCVLFNDTIRYNIRSVS